LSAWDYGLEEGRTYLQSNEDVTCSQYRQIGKKKARSYVKEDRQIAYYAGWLRAAGLHANQPIEQEIAS